MVRANKNTVNFAGGEVDPLLLAREDIQLITRAAQRLENFISLPQGPVTFRSGFYYVHHTRKHNPAVFLEFQFSDVQAYLIEATEGYFRFYKDEGIIFKSSALTITGITKANPGVVTYTGTDPTEGEEVYISGVSGMTEVNGRFFTINNLDTGANTFELTDEFGNNIDTTNYTTYTADGTVQIIYEIKTPYLEEHLEKLMYDQNADTMYITCRDYASRKLTRTAHDAWSLARYTRTADPFDTENVTSGTITAITAANPGVVSDAAHTFIANDHVYISGITGMVELNDRHFLIGTVAAGTYQLKDYDTGVVVDTSGYTAYSAGGGTELVGEFQDTRSELYPGAVKFTDGGRLAFGGTYSSPETVWFSRAPNSAGATRYDDFTTGTNADDSMKFRLAPLQGQVDSVKWLANNDRFLAVGTFGSVRRMFGATEGEVVAVDAVTAKSANSDGVFLARPITDGPSMFYISRSQLTLESIEFDYKVDGYFPNNRTLVAPHLTSAGLAQGSRQTGLPNVIWVRRTDGVLLSMTLNSQENIYGWTRHKIGGSGFVEAIGIMPRENNKDQLWAIIKRTINGNTVRYVEFMEDVPTWPVPDDFFTDPDNEEDDTDNYLNYMFEQQKHANHLDASLTYNGNITGIDADATITMGANADVDDATGVTVTSDNAVFTSAMVGRQIWGVFASDGSRGGRLEITGFTSSTQVTGTILEPFDALDVFAPGDWFLTVTSVSGLSHLEGEEVKLITDGAVPEAVTVEDAEISFNLPASIVHVGLGYNGLIRTIPVNHGGITGTAQNKRKIIAEIAARFVNSAGVRVGSSFYRMVNVDFRTGQDVLDRPVPLFTGSRKVSYDDKWDDNKELCILHSDPLPCTIAALDIFTETSDE